MECSSCRYKNPEGLKFCENCGNSLGIRCPNCGFENPSGFRFCGECGTTMIRETSQKAIETSTEAERRQITVLFCDLVGSTALSSRLEPEALREVIRDYQPTCAKVIRHYKGFIARYFGDGILVYFGYPMAHEDDPQRAVHTGLEIVEAMVGLNTTLEKEEGIQLNVRIGIHTGLVVAGDIDKDERLEAMAVIGETPNIAARLEGLAEPDTVVISPATHRLVEGVFIFQDMGEHTLKGISQPMKIYRVLGKRDEANRLQTVTQAKRSPLMGRGREAAMLMTRWEQVQVGTGQVVLLSGEAGIGKSRLVQMVNDRLTDQPHASQELSCSPYHRNSPLYPVIHMNLWKIPSQMKFRQFRRKC